MKTYTLARQSEPQYGFTLSYKREAAGSDPGGYNAMAVINGNAPNYYKLPVVLLSIDPHIVYGMSHPDVIETLLETGPQIMLSTRDLPHKMFEHGMKASLGRMEVGRNTFLTNINTFYDVQYDFPNFGIVVDRDKNPGLLVKDSGQIPALITTRKFGSITLDYKRFNLEDIEDSVVLT